MAKDIEALQLQMSADIRQFQKEMAKLRETADKRLTEVERRALQSSTALSRIMEQSGRRMTESFRSGLGGIAGVLAAAFSAEKVIEYADSYTTLQNGLKVAGLEGAKLAKVEDSLYAAANRNGIAVGSVAQLYQRAAQSRKSLGATDEQLIRLTDGVAAALKVQGVSATAATGPLLQLSQAIGSGIVRAEEFNSLAEGTPIILQAAATGITRFGGDIAKLRGEVLKGNVTSREFFAGLLAGLPAVEKQASGMSLTVSGSLQILNNQLGRYVGQTDKSLSATARMAQGIQAFANNLDLVIQGATVLVTLIGTRWVVATTTAAVSNIRYQATLLTMAAAQQGVARSSLLATTAVSGMNSVLAFFGGPIGLAVMAVAAALAVVATESANAGRAVTDLDAAIEGSTAALQKADGYLSSAADNAKSLGNQATTAGGKLDTFAGKVKGAADQLYNLAEAHKAAAIAELEAEREKVSKAVSDAQLRSKDVRRKNFGDELTGKPAATPSEAFARGARFAGGEVKNWWTGGESDRALNDVIDRGMNRLSEIDARIKGMAATAASAFVPKETPTGATGKAKTDAQKRREDEEKKRQERAKQDIEIDEKIAAARAIGDAAAIKAAEDEQRLVQVTRRYEDEGVKDAVARAAAYQKNVTAAEALADLAEREAAATADQAQWAADLIAKGEERRRLAEEIAQSEIESRLEIARLSGNEKGVKAAERELFIVQRIAELRRLNPNASEQGNRSQATREADTRDTARKYGEARQMFANAFAEGIRAAASGDLKTFLSNMVGSALEEGLRRIGGLIFDQVFGNAQAAVKGTITGTAQGAAVSTAMVAAGATTAATISAAIISAGSAAGAVMAAQIAAAGAASGATSGVAKGASEGLASVFKNLTSYDGGGYTGNSTRSGGLDGKGGRLAMVHPREIVTDLTKGLPSPSQMGRASSGMTYAPKIDLRGAVMTEDLVARLEGQMRAGQRQTLSMANAQSARSFAARSKSLNTMGTVR